MLAPIAKPGKDGHMFEALGSSALGGASRDVVLSKRALGSDAETGAAMSMRDSGERTESSTGSDTASRRIATEILRSVNARLPGRVRDLRVRFVDDHFVMSGVSSSYYVKQVAQHVAMAALDAQMLGRLVNEIEVRSVR
jgi:hypothetical protein